MKAKERLAIRRLRERKTARQAEQWVSILDRAFVTTEQLMTFHQWRRWPRNDAAFRALSRRNLAGASTI